jgi:chemotaxis protein methyltransferase CheR
MGTIDPFEFQLWTRYIHEICGISLGTSKAYLIETRLRPLITEFGCAGFNELYRKARKDCSGVLEKRIVDLITTHETRFFRDHDLFELLKNKILPDVIEQKSHWTLFGMKIPIRIWSAGCSTGQEAYSIAMAVSESLHDNSLYRVSILGTDISGAAVYRASRGVYSVSEVERGLSSERLVRYFVPTEEGFRVRDEIRAMVTFRKMNFLLPLTGMGRFDIVFCRNVAMYFQEEDRRRLFENIETVLAPNGYLVVGATESLRGVAPRFEPKRCLRAVCYQVGKES